MEPNIHSEDLVSKIAAETAARIDASRDLRKLQTKLLEQQQHERLFGPRRNRLKRKMQAMKIRTRGRCHFGTSAKFENKIEETFSSEDNLYFKFSSGQLVRADKAIRIGRNPHVRKLVAAAIDANANRT